MRELKKTVRMIVLSPMRQRSKRGDSAAQRRTKIPSSDAKSSTTIDTIVSMVVLLIYRRLPLWYKGL